MAISLANSSCSPTRLGIPLDEKGPQQKQSMWHRLGLRRWLGREDRDASPERADRRRQSSPLSPHNHDQHHHSHHNHRAASADNFPRAKQDNLTRRLSRKVGVGLPRSTNFKRQIPEHRDRLAPLEPDHRRAQSADRQLSVQRTRTHSPPPTVGPRLSAPEVQWLGPTPASTVDDAAETNDESDLHADWENPSYPDVTTTPSEIETDLDREKETETQAPVPASATLQDDLEMELEQRWILNLSMHFRDNSGREKFFVTYAETPTKWRRVTISMDYRGAPPDSLERDLEELRYQRDKCARIYESIRESLAEIQFYDTVTNLKVETLDGRLHVHVTEDVNEIIPYPPIASIRHLRGARCVPEHLLHFDSHLSGFVYKVQLGGHPYIKKEIPGPDTVDEFLYEINALHALNGAPNVIRVEGIVVDDSQEVVKGLLISYAEQGALVDMLYEQRGRISFDRRERWAKQIVQGLCEIHESGYVQGDFTLSNIVVDANDDAHIIDINRRGCPVGWEPPEIAAKIESNQRISMYIGVKTDLYQLGMTLWALATGEDEPERQHRPLVLGYDIDVPDYYRRLVDICLSPMPRHRLGAKELLHFFPPDLLSRRSRPPSRILLPHEMESAPFMTPTNGLYPLPPAETQPQYRRKESYEQELPKPQSESRPRSMLADNHDEGKRSTITLAESTGDADFAPRHSSASTLNHDDPHNTTQCWDRNQYSFGNSNSEPTPDAKVQNAVPIFWANNMENGNGANVAEPSTPLEPSTSQNESAHIPAQELSEDQKPSLLPIESHSEALPIAEHTPSPTRKHVSFDTQTDDDSHSTTSLLLSALPINPALNLSKRRSLPSVLKDAQTLDRKTQFDSVSSLAESRLPINPALGLSQRRSLPAIPRNTQPQTPAAAAAESESIRQTLITFLSESQLPINPAFSEKLANLP
jgi:serine/threonine protein kinase